MDGTWKKTKAIVINKQELRIFLPHFNEFKPSENRGPYEAQIHQKQWLPVADKSESNGVLYFRNTTVLYG